MALCELCETNRGEGWCGTCASLLNARNTKRDKNMAISTQDIADRVVRAVATLRSLPPELDALALAENTSWPPLILQARTQYLSEQAGPRVAPTRKEVQELHEVVLLLSTLDESTALLVWLKAEGRRWRTITEQARCLRHKAWQRWQTGLVRMAQQARTQARLNAAALADGLDHDHCDACGVLNEELRHVIGGVLCAGCWTDAFPFDQLPLARATPDHGRG